MGALPGGEPAPGSARELTEGFSRRGCLGSALDGKAPRGQPGVRSGQRTTRGPVTTA